MEIISRNHIRNLLKKRRLNTHKGTYGKVLIIAGSKGMVGAAALASRAALRAGAGLVSVSIEEEFFPIIQASVPESTCINREFMDDVLNGFDSVVVGPGMGRESYAAHVLSDVLSTYEGSLVVDADALNIVAHNHIDLRKTKGRLIITPHVGEASILTGINSHEINSDREKVVSYLSEITGATSILKGYGTLVCPPRRDKQQAFEVYENPTGNPGMATGGSGDILSGMIGGFAAQGMSQVDAALVGVYIHGYAGDLAGEDKGEYGLIASDIVENIAYAIKKTYNSSN
jgi:NAD(P)H-hydrate epimerase